MNPKTGVLVVARAWPYQSYSEKALSSALSIYNTLIAIALRDFNAIVDFYLPVFNDGVVDMQI